MVEMATQPLDHYTLEQYLEIEDTLDYRSEFHDGVILPVELATPTHALLEAAVLGVLKGKFSNCAVYGPGLNLYIASANKVVHPDATVLCEPANYPKRDCIDNPTVIVEVISPSTKDYNHGTKRENYFSLSTLQHYLLVSQTEKTVGHYQRSGSGLIYVDHGSDAIVLLGKVAISVGDIYAGIL